MPTETTTIKKPAVKTVRAKKPAKAKTEEVIAKTETAAVAAPLEAGTFLSALGRRKTSIANVRLIKIGTGKLTVNGKPFDAYFRTFELRGILQSPLKMVALENVVDMQARVSGGGIRGQAEAVRLGMCRALVELNPTYRKTLKKLGYLTRDPRAKERKKFGLKKARRAPQWSKR